MIIDFSKYKLEILLFILFFYSLIFCNLSKSRVLFIESNEECMSYFGLPSEYQEVEYIGTTGTQYIDTGIFPGTNIQVETKITVQSTAQEKTVFGNYKSSSTASYLYYHLTAYSNAWYYGINGSEGHAGSYSPVIGTQYELVYNNENNQLSVNGTEVGSVSGTQGQSGSTLYISARGTTNNCYGYFNYYYFKVFNKTTGEYERDFVPCYRKSDGVIGMYDKITKTFFTNTGSGTFTKGKDVNVKRSDFQEVEYIQSSGTQWVDTLFTPTINTKSQIKFMNMEYTSNVIYGFYAGDDNKDYRIFNENSNYKTYFDIGGNRLISGNNTMVSNVLYELEIGNDYVKDIPSGEDVVRGTEVSSFTANGTITLNGSTSSSDFSKNKWYYVKIYEGSELVRDFIPCYRKSDGVIGMIDDVNKVFYTNDGSGTFTKGGDIN